MESTQLQESKLDDHADCDEGEPDYDNNDRVEGDSSDLATATVDRNANGDDGAAAGTSVEENQLDQKNRMPSNEREEQTSIKAVKPAEQMTDKDGQDVSINMDGRGRKHSTAGNTAKRQKETDEQLARRENRKQRRAKEWANFKSAIKDICRIFVPWKSTFKRIEGEFGTTTLSYFWFVRLLLLVNLFSTIVILSTTILPQVLISPSSFQDTVNCTSYSHTEGDGSTPMIPVTADIVTQSSLHTVPDISTSGVSDGTTRVDNSGANYRETVGIKEACLFSKNYTDSIIPIEDRSAVNVILDILQGTDWMELSVLFIGFYFDKPSYLTSQAFLFSALGCFLVILFLITTYMSWVIKSSIVESSGENKQKYSVKVFGFWDHMLTTQKAADRKMKNFYDEIIAKKKKVPTATLR